MIQGITKQEFIEILDERLEIKLEEKLDRKLALFEFGLMKKVETLIDIKIDAFAFVVNKSFQALEDKMVTKEELVAAETRLESKMSKRFDFVEKRLDTIEGKLRYKFNWFL